MLNAYYHKVLQFQDLRNEEYVETKQQTGIPILIPETRNAQANNQQLSPLQGEVGEQETSNQLLSSQEEGSIPDSTLLSCPSSDDLSYLWRKKRKIPCPIPEEEENELMHVVTVNEPPQQCNHDENIDGTVNDVDLGDLKVSSYSFLFPSSLRFKSSIFPGFKWYFRV